MKICRWSIIILLYLLCLAGCEQQEIPADRTDTETFSVDWKTDGLPFSQEVREEQALWTSEYIPWLHDDVPYDRSTESIYYGVLEPGVCGEQVYRLYRLVSQEGESRKSRYLLEAYDLSSMQASFTEIDSDKLGVGDGYIAGMGVTGPDNYTFRVVEYDRKLAAETGQSKQLNHHIAYSDLGEHTRIVDVRPLYLEKDIQDMVNDGECICDAEGNSYTRTSSSRDLYILDKEGNLLMEHKGKENDQIMSPFQMPQGELVFPIYTLEDKTTRLVWFDLEQTEAHTLASFGQSIMQVYGIQNNELYYESYDGIVRWNLLTGDRVLVYRFDQNAIPKAYQTMLVFREGQSPVLRMYGTVNDEEEDWLLVLSEQEVQRPEATQVVSLNGVCSNVQDCAAVASRRHPDYSFTYKESTEADKSDFRTRIMAEMIAGDGPDILYVSLEDMRLLQSKGLLMDLGSILPEETLDRILPVVIELGTLDGTLVGLAPEAYPHSMITLKDIWDQDSWTLENVMDLMETGDFTVVFCQDMGGDSVPFSSRATLLQLVEYGLWDSSLIDWKSGESRFDSDFFIRILDFAQTYGGDPYGPETWLGAGGCPEVMLTADIERINELYDQYGENYYFVGMPTTGNCGSYLVCSGVLVVNRAADPGAVSAFFECLLRDEIQYANRILTRHNSSILKISPDDVVFWEEENEQYARWKNHLLRIKEDGTTTLDDYEELREKCIPYPTTYDEILDIVWEECQSYIAGDKSAADVARIVNSRIQIYLDERDGKIP